MSRMRMVKPEFWTSEQITNLTRDARLLFIGLWNFCDDAGIHQASIRRLRIEVFPADPLTDADISELIDQLLKEGLVARYSVDGHGEYWQVTGWHHQKIDQPTYKHPRPDGTIPEGPAKRRQANVRGAFGEQSANVREAFAGCSPPDGNGRELEWRGEEIGSAPPALPSPRTEEGEAKKSEKEKTPFQLACRATFESYSQAFKNRYGAPPVPNAELYSKIQQLVKKLGHDESPPVAEFFVGLHNEYYVKRGHEIGALVSDANKVRTEWVTGRKITAAQARQADRTATNANAAEEAIRILEAQGMR